MTERPILFSGPMVRAILDGSKTQTRRVVRPGTPDDWNRCPYGGIGDRLWVRETWAPDPPIDDSWASTGWAGCGRLVREIPERFQHPRYCAYAADWLHGPIRWTPSIHMPRWASRIVLEVTDVRAQRLQDISDEDVIAEGVDGSLHLRGDDDIMVGAVANELDMRAGKISLEVFPRARFVLLWDSINGTNGRNWEANPWVWAVSFKRVASS